MRLYKGVYMRACRALTEFSTGFLQVVYAFVGSLNNMTSRFFGGLRLRLSLIRVLGVRRQVLGYHRAQVMIGSSRVPGLCKEGCGDAT